MGASGRVVCGRRTGSRRIGFIAGDAGIGKTALVDAFVGRARRATRRSRAGQCIEQYGAGEAYLPILEALGRLGRERRRAADRAAADARAELAGAPAVAATRPTPRRSRPRPAGRMLRELAEALEVFTAREPLVLVLEDLHWSDSATLEWLAYVARRRDPARLLVLGTYRPVEAAARTSPLRAAARVSCDIQPQCARVVLDSLAETRSRLYLRQRCGSIPGSRSSVAAPSIAAPAAIPCSSRRSSRS